MARRGGWQRERNDPPGWGNNQQPARTFGSSNAPPQQQQQQQNRFQALQPARGGRGGGGACYLCGQPGHLQRNCPQASGGGGGGGGGRIPGGAGAQRPGGPARVGAADLRRFVADDMRESPPWPLSCYAPDLFHGPGGAGSAGLNLREGDVSFEEARAAAYCALATGGPQAAHANNQRLTEVAQRRLADRRQLEHIAQAVLMQQLQAAEAGRPEQGAMPELNWNFPGGTPVQSPGFSPLLQPMHGPMHAPPVSFPNPLQQPAEQQRMPQPPPPPMPDARAVPPAAQPPAASDAECWMAPAFRRGAIPETPPPAQFA